MYGAILGDIIGSRFEFDRGDKSKDFELFGKADTYLPKDMLDVINDFKGEIEQ